jgi:methyl-accepting chemotaxis protein
MTIARRLGIMIGSALLALLFLGAFGLYQQQQASLRFDAVQSNVLPSIRALTTARDAFNQIRRLNYRYLVEAADRDAARKSTDESRALLLRMLDTYDKSLVADATDRSLLDADKAALATFASAALAFRKSVDDGDTAAGHASLSSGGAIDASSAGVVNAIGKHLQYNEELARAVGEEGAAKGRTAQVLMLAAMGAGIVVLGVMGWSLFRIVTRGLNSIRNACAEVSSSLDLTRYANVDRNDEIGATATAFNALLTRVASVISEVSHAAEAVTVASRQIAAGNTDLSARTEEQAASLEETAASMEEITSTVRQSGESAREANRLARDTSASSDRGSAVVAQMVRTMDEIGAHASKISEITALIEGIAFQTNILALNAAVEAARAGDQGRGFAVVAGEVRTLAQRSSTAAKEIKELIERSSTTVAEGARLASEAGRQTEAVHNSTRSVEGLIGEIAAAAEEQGHGIEQVNQAVSQMDQVTQQNAALVEEAAAAAQSLQEQAVRLNEMASAFTVEGTRAARRHGADGAAGMLALA